MRHFLLLGVLARTLAWGQIPAAVSPTQQAAPDVAATDASTPAQSAPKPGGQQPDQATVQSKMADSLAKQRLSVLKQVTGVMGKAPSPAASFFTVPWVETPVQFNTPPCEPLPAAELDKLVEQNSQQEGVKPELIRGVIAQESGARPCAVSWKGAQGLMQLMPATSEQFGVRDPFDPHQNVEAGTKLLKQLLTKYKDDVSLALAAYNAGEARVDHDGGIPQIQETQNYVTEIQSKLSKK